MKYDLIVKIRFIACFLFITSSLYSQVNSIYSASYNSIDSMLDDKAELNLKEANFDDYAGKKEWNHMFVSTLMATGKGNCHSLPLFYKLLAEELGEKSWLALAPNHVYIKLYSQADGWYNVELTSGQFPTDVWIKASGYIHTDAIRSGIYMDTLSLKSTVALCLTDLAEGYKHKFTSDYDPEFVLKCCNRTLDVFPNYIHALLLKAETLLDICMKTKNNEYEQVIEKHYSHIHQLGYRKMLEKMYLEWLQSLKKCFATYY